MAARADDEEPQYPDACFPDHWYERAPFLKGNDESPFWQGWSLLRLKTFRLIENKYFETAVIIMILLSSLALVSRPSILARSCTIDSIACLVRRRHSRTSTCPSGPSCRTYSTTWTAFSR